VKDLSSLGKDLDPEVAHGLYSNRDFYCSSVTLGNTLDLILLSDGIRVSSTDSLGGVDNLVSKSFSHRLVGSEGGLSGSFAQQVDSLVDSSQRRNINGLSSDGTTRSNSSGVLSGTRLNDGLENNLKRVLVSEQVDNLEGLSEDADGHLFLTVLARVTNHKLIDESLEDGAGNFLESLLLIFTSGIWHVYLCFISLDGQVIIKGLLRAVNILIGPLAEKLRLDGKSLISFLVQFF